MKKFLAFMMVVMLFCLIPVSTSATENGLVLAEDEIVVYQDEEITITQQPSTVTTRSAPDYGSVWLDSSNSGSFTVTTTRSGTIGITVEVQSSSNDSFAEISMRKPNGQTLSDPFFISPTTKTGDSNGIIMKIYGAPSGTYTLDYIAYTDIGMRIMCWMY